MQPTRDESAVLKSRTFLAMGTVVSLTAAFPADGSPNPTELDAAVRLIGRGETLLETFTRHSRPFNADKAREVLAGDWLCDGTPMERDLALPAPRPLGEGLRELWEWYRTAGWLR